MGETMLLILLLVLPALVGAQLSSRGRRGCFIGGLLVALCLVFLVPTGGADSPLNSLAIIFFVGAALGAGIAEGVSLLRRVKKGSLHG